MLYAYRRGIYDNDTTYFKRCTRPNISKPFHANIQNTNSPDLKELNNKQLEYLAKSVIIDNLKEQLKNEVKKANLKIDKT
jgi:hypothetical protein